MGPTVLLSALSLLLATAGGRGEAQQSIQADGSLSNPSVVVYSAGDKTYTINGGTLRNNNRALFHSFQLFNLLQGETGHFNNGPDVQSIFSRVTGGSASSIDGLIKANGGANLYLINPKGIVLGPNARIDIGGTFHASTAQAVTFGDLAFSAVNPQDAPLLTSDIVPGLQFGNTPATLKNEGVLVVQNGKQLLLSGGPADTVSSTGELRADGGEIRLSGGTVEVTGKVTANGGSVNLQGTSATVDGGSLQADGGSISIQGSDTALIAGASLQAKNSGSGPTLKTGSIAIQGGSVTLGANTGRTILLAGSGALTPEEGPAPAPNLTLLDAGPTGNGGTISITGGDDRAIQIFSGVAVPGTPQGVTTIRGASTITAKSSSSSGAQGRIVVGGLLAGDPITASTVSENTTLGSGASLMAGNGLIELVGTKKVDNQATIVGNTIQRAPRFQITRANLEGFTTKPNTPFFFQYIATGNIDVGFGPAESLEIHAAIIGDARKLSLRAINGEISFSDANISVLAGNSEQAGAFEIIAKNGITMSDSSLVATGVNGKIDLSSERGTIALSGSTLESSLSDAVGLEGKKAGSIYLNAPKISLDGSKDSERMSLIKATTSGAGGGGSVNLKADSVTLNKAKVTAQTSGSGDAGTINVDADTFTLNAGSNLTVETSSTGKAGGVSINTNAKSPTNLTINLAGNSQINAKSNTNATGRGGSITIGAASKILTINGSKDAAITAETLGSGNGGDIALTGDTIQLNQATVTAQTSGAGNAGQINATSDILTLDQGSQINSTTIASGEGGLINLSANQISLKGHSLITASALGSNANSFQTGAGGTIRTIAKDITLAGGSELATKTSSSGNGGGIRVNSGSLQLGSSSLINTQAISIGRGGTILIQPNSGGSLEVKGPGRIETTSTGSLPPGAIRVGGDAGPSGGSTTLSDGITLQTNRSTIDVGSTGATAIQGGLLQSDGGLITVTGSTSTSITGGTLTANKSATTAGRVVVGGTLSDTTASASSASTTVGSGANLTATGGTIELLSTDAISSSGVLAADGGSINLRGPSATIGGGSLRANSGSISVSGATTSLLGGSLQADGGSISIQGSDTALITGASLQAKNSGSGPTLKPGSIAIQGGSVTLGADTGRTILLAGSGAVASEEESTPAPNLTLLDAGPTGHGGTISVIGGDDRAIQIFSGVAVPGTAQGVTTLRGASSITAKSTPGSVTKGRIVVGGTLSGTTANASSPSTTVGSGTNLTDTGGTIELLSTDAISSNGTIAADGGSISVSGATTSLLGVSLQADGGSISIKGSDSALIARASLKANNTNSGPAPKTGSIAVVGGDVTLGADTGRTILLAGSGAVASDEDPTTAPDLTLLDAGLAGNGGMISVIGGTDKAIQIYSGSVKTPATPGVTTIRGASTITATQGRIVVGGTLSRGTASSSIPSATSKSTSVKEGVCITAKNIEFLSTDRLVVESTNNGSSRLVKPDFAITKDNFGQLLRDYKDGNQYFFDASNLITISEVNSVVKAIGSSAARFTFQAVNDIEFKNSSITVEPGQGNTAGAFRVVSTKGSVQLIQSQLIANGEMGRIYLNAAKDISLSAGQNISQSGNTTSKIESSVAVGKKAGNIDLTAQEIHLLQGSEIKAETSGSGIAGDISLKGTSLINLEDRATVTAKTTGSGNGGTINVDADTFTLSSGSNLTVETSSTGKAGGVSINTNAKSPTNLTINLAGNSQINAKSNTNATGEGGSITIGVAGKILTINGSEGAAITAETLGSGAGGNIALTGGTIQLNQAKVTAQTSGTGSGGTIIVKADNLTLSNKSKLSTSSNQAHDVIKTGTGQAGAIKITANTAFKDDLGRGLFALTGNSEISSATSSSNPFEKESDLGTITIAFPDIRLTDSKINTSTSGRAKGGLIIVDTDTLSLDSTANNNIKSELTTQTTSKGDGGTIKINSQSHRDLKISLSGHSLINALTEHRTPEPKGGQGGNISIGTSQATLKIDGSGTITAETRGSGRGGDITLHGSTITLGTVTSTQQIPGNGAAIPPQDDSANIGPKITAEAVGTKKNDFTTGDGGTINVTANSLSLTGNSQLNTQTSSSGQGGTININNQAPQNLDIALSEDSKINALTESKASGNGGSITVGTTGAQLIVTGNGTITAETLGSGAGGNIALTGDTIQFNQAKVTAQTSGTGSGGTIIVNADNLTLSNKSKLSTSSNQAHDVIKPGTGQAGAIKITANTAFKDDLGRGLFALTGNSEISSATSSSNPFEKESDLGTITIAFPDIRLIDSKINVSTSGNAKGGLIIVDTDTLSLGSTANNNIKSELTTQTTSKGDGGTIKINSQSHRDLKISLSGDSKINALTNLTIPGGGHGGDITIGTSEARLKIDGPGTVTAETQGSGTGGDISLKGRFIKLDKKATVTAQTSGSGDGGSINVDADAFTLGSYSNLTVETFSTGKAGDISIYTSAESPSNLIINMASNSRINAKSDSNATGRGGSIKIDAASKILTINGSKDASITAETLGSGNGGDVALTGDTIQLNQVTVTAQTSGVGNAGQINATSDTLVLDQRSQVNSTTIASGGGGLINLSANQISLKGHSLISASALGSSANSFQTGAGGTIRTIAKDITLAGGSEFATKTSSSGNGGTIHINSETPRDLTIRFRDDSKINASTSLETPGGGRGGDITLGTPQAQLLVSGQGTITAETLGTGDGGQVVLNGAPVALANGATATTRTGGTMPDAGKGGQVVVNAPALLLAGGKLTTESSGRGQAGTIDIRPTGNGPFLLLFSDNGEISADAGSSGGLGGSIRLDTGARDLRLSGLGLVTVQTRGSGPAGTIDFRAHQISLDQRSRLSAITTAGGRGGTINLSADTITLDNGSTVSTNSEQRSSVGSSGPAGTINILARGPNSLHLSNGSQISSTTSSNNPYTDPADLANISIDSPSITLSGGSSINASTSGAARGGAITLRSPSITIDADSTITSATSGSGTGGSLLIDAAGQTARINGPGRISAATSGTGVGGSLQINSRHTTLDNGVTLTAGTSGPGRGGTISLTRQGQLSLDNRSRVTTRSESGAGRAGDIRIHANSLRLGNGSEVSADGTDNGQAGNISLTVRDDLRLDGRSRINANTARSTDPAGGANIDLRVGGNLVMKGGSTITASATGQANGGNLTLTLDNGFLLAAFPPTFNGNDILASAMAGNGGRILVRALGIFGVNPYTFATRISDVSARAASGRDGVVAFFVPYLTPDRGVVPIEAPIDPDNDLVRVCAPRADGQRAEFTQTGRGGLPLLPGDRPGNPSSLDDLGPTTAPQPTSPGARPQAPSFRGTSPAPAPSGPPLATAAATLFQTPAWPLPPCPEPR